MSQKKTKPSYFQFISLTWKTSKILDNRDPWFPEILKWSRILPNLANQKTWYDMKHSKLFLLYAFQSDTNFSLVKRKKHIRTVFLLMPTANPGNTLDGRNPAPVDMVNISLVKGFTHPRWCRRFQASAIILEWCWPSVTKIKVWLPFWWQDHEPQKHSSLDIACKQHDEIVQTKKIL